MLMESAFRKKITRLTCLSTPPMWSSLLPLAAGLQDGTLLGQDVPEVDVLGMEEGRSEEED